MPAGRPRKSTEQKKLEGTYRADRDAPAETASRALEAANVIFPPGTKISCPKSIRTKPVRAYWKRLTAALVSLRVLSAVDIPQLEQLCNVLEKLNAVRDRYMEEPPEGEAFERLQKSYATLSGLFDKLASKYYISPAARSRLTLDALNCTKTAQDIRRADSAIDTLLAGRG